MNPSVRVFVPLGDKKLLESKGISEVSEFGWWDSVEIKNTEIVFTPAQHWSGRGLFDRNKSWWGGWLIRTREMSIFHAGDTGYSKDFIETKIRLGAPKYALIPIGAYDPEWFMSASHVNPEDSVRIMKDLQAQYGIGMHWGTFTLTAEDTLEPRIRLNNAVIADGVQNFRTIVPGELVFLE